MAKRWTVGKVARLARVTVRTLHHYDEIGLLVPSERSEAGYRLYSEADLQRLHRILLCRELDVPLEGIQRLLDEPGLGPVGTLRAQRTLLAERLRRTEAVLRAVDRTLSSMEGDPSMSVEELFEDLELGDAPDDVRAHHRQHREETRERWGDTDAWAESMRRTRRYTKNDWAEINAEREALESRMAALLQAGEHPEGPAAREVAERMRVHVGRWFYALSPEMHAGLADMYEADGRFRRHYDGRAEGLATFVARAVRANARDRS